MELQVNLVGRTDLAGEIYRQLRRAILDGRLQSGDRLPPTRELARGLSVSRTTVTVAYDRLAGEGFVTSRIGAGTYVRHRTTQRAGRPRRAPGALRPRPVWDTIPLPLAFDGSADFDFRVGVPDAQLFPYQTWRRLMSQELQGPVPEMAGYGSPAGHQGLREAIDTVVRRASALGVKVQPLSMFDVDSPSRPGIVLGYGAIPTARIDAGMDLLRRCFDD